MGELTRRQFVRGVAATAAATMTAGVVGIGFAFGGSQATAFRVEHSDQVKVWIGNGEQFSMEVIDRATGDILEAHTILSAESLLQLNSDHVSFHRIDPPGM